MFRVEINDGVVLREQMALQAALSTDAKTQKALQKLIRKVIMEARSKIVGNIKFDNGDPRHAARSVRTVVYKKLLGANVNIYNSRKKHDTNNYEPPRVLQPGQRGGNRRPRGGRTKQIMGYGSLDRGFILRWVDEGTQERAIKYKETTIGKNGRRKTRWVSNASVYGNRGKIVPRHFFRKLAEPQIVQAADTLADLIEIELCNIINEKSK